LILSVCHYKQIKQYTQLARTGGLQILPTATWPTQIARFSSFHSVSSSPKCRQQNIDWCRSNIGYITAVSCALSLALN